MRKRLPREALENTQEVAEKVGFEFELYKVHPPGIFDNAGELLKKLCFERLPRAYGPLKLGVLKRLSRELELILSRGFASYFLVVHEVVSWARQRGIRCSIRGSAAGSLVSYLLFGGPDPLKNGLLFERFLNEARFDPPDIDVDFDSERREEVLRFVLQRFGEKAALVSTVTTFRARSAVRETARALGLGLQEASLLCDLLPYHLRPSEIPEALKRS